MMHQILWWFFILFLEMGIFYMVYLFFTKNAKKKLEKEWQEKHEQLKSWEKNLKSQYAQMEWKNICEQNNISQIKSEIIKEYEKALSSVKIAEKIRDDSYLKINDLQKRINQLQSELFQARKRAKRFANRTKKEVKISV